MTFYPLLYQIEQVVFSEIGVKGGDLRVMASEFFENGGFSLKSLLNQLVNLGIVGDGFELFDDAATTGGHLGIFGEKGFAEPSASKGMEDVVALVEQRWGIHR
ncbi:hypothetical protein AY599_18870 [Leptolyngbya valderiana BDU 20041]|nr:hypothetical protein AY599_18870 [Leptolyngbya valderiana BDU 20041]